MKAITQSTYSAYNTASQPNLLSRLFTWSNSQEKNRFGWLALSLAAQGCVLTPIVTIAVGASGGNLVLWIAAMLAMGMVLIVNLAAMPTKITIPTFLLSIVIDIAIIVACLAQVARSLNL